ncbi:MAG: energy transducer TonB [Bdellovibrio sp.]|jgi:TonB family protein
MKLKRRGAIGLSLGLHVSLVALMGGLRFFPDLSNTGQQPIEIQTLLPLKTDVREKNQLVASKPRPIEGTANSKTDLATPALDQAADSGPSSSADVPSAQGTSSQVAETASQISLQSRYEHYVRTQIAKQKTYPPAARRLGHTGRVVLTFRVLASGEVQNTELRQASPYDSINQDALKILKSLARLEPIPKELNRTYWDFLVPLDYDLE